MNADYYLGREQTLIKHKLLERYLKAALPILGSWSDDLYYVDCLAGPWQTVDPAFSDTSFSIAVNVLRSTRPVLASRGRYPTLRALFIENDKGSFANLSDFVNSIQDIDIAAKNWDFEQSVDKIVKSVRRRSGSFPFFFIDPTGWECAAIPLIKPLLQVQPGEVLINLMTSWITRFLKDPTKPFSKLLGAGYEKITDLRGDAREEAIVDAYTEAVRSTGAFPYVCTMPVLKSTDEAFHFHMIYATRNPKGVEEFKRAENEIVPFMHGVRADAKQGKVLQRTGQYSLLSASEMYVDGRYSRYRAANLQRAEKAVDTKLAASRSVEFDLLWAEWMQFACVQDEDLQSWLQKARCEGKISINQPSERASKISRKKGITIAFNSHR